MSLTITVLGIKIAAPIVAYGLRIAAYEINRAWNEYQNKQRSKSMSNASTTNIKGIAILGTKGSGKTTLLNVLRGKSYEKPDITSYDKYKEFVYNKQNGNSVTIRQGVDIGGGSSFRIHYEPMIENADVVFFLFDISKWKTNEEDRREIRSRLQFVTEKCIKNDKFLVTLLTHPDILNTDEIKTILSQYKNDVCERDNGSYKAAVVDYPFVPLNTTDESSVKQLIDTYL
jgi:GTPase SAR1 family protein